MSHSFLTLPLVFLLVGALLIVVTSWVIALAMLRPGRMTDGKAMYLLRRLSPGDLGLRYENVAFDVRDEQRGGRAKLRLAAWWIPNEQANGRCVILLHGYADAKVGVIAWAPLWHALGFNILALDLRGHGDSGLGSKSGRDVTGGYFECHDVDQVIDQLQSERPHDARRIVLFGASLGGLVALAAAHLRQRKGSAIDAVVLDCPVSDYRNALMTHASRLGAPSTIIMPLAVRMAQWISGARFDDLNGIDLVGSAMYPVMLIESGDDDFVGSNRGLIAAAALNEREHSSTDRHVWWCVPGAAHLMAISVAPDEYARRLGDFLRSALSKPTP